MAYRVSTAEVKEIIDTDLATSVINSFISMANITVSEILGDDTTISAAQLKEIERWLTAHFIACGPEPKAQSQKTGDASIKYQGKTGKGLEATLYGQQVMILDTTGKMAANTGKKRASLVAVTSFA